MRWGILVVLMLCAASARAQDIDGARAEVEEASRQYEAGNYQLALEGFESAYTRVEGAPDVQTMILFNIGRCQQQLGYNARALATFERFLNEAPSDVAERQRALDYVRELRRRVDAGDTGPTEGGGGSALLYSGIAIAALGGAALIASIGTGVVAMDGDAQLETMCPSGECPPSSSDLLDETDALAIATDVLWIAGASLAAIGVVLLAIGATSNESPTAGAACARDGCIATLRARF